MFLSKSIVRNLNFIKNLGLKVPKQVKCNREESYNSLNRISNFINTEFKFKPYQDYDIAVELNHSLGIISNTSVNSTIIIL